MDLTKAHAIASDIFIGFNLSYVFISKLVPRIGAGAGGMLLKNDTLNQVEVLSAGDLGKAADGTAASKGCSFTAVSLEGMNSSGTSDGWTLVPGSTDTLIRFTFSKPTVEDPRPLVAVETFVEVIAYNPNLAAWRYLVRVEGQRFSRLVEVREEDIGNAEAAKKAFSEKWIDKVFGQKEAVLGRKLWVK